MAAPQSSALRALALEYKSLQEDPLEGIRPKLLNEDNLFEWEVALFGPPDTLYAGGYFKVSYFRELVFDRKGISLFIVSLCANKACLVARPQWLAVAWTYVIRQQRMAQRYHRATWMISNASWIRRRLTLVRTTLGDGRITYWLLPCHCKTILTFCRTHPQWTLLHLILLEFPPQSSCMHILVKKVLICVVDFLFCGAVFNGTCPRVPQPGTVSKLQTKHWFVMHR